MKNHFKGLLFCWVTLSMAFFTSAKLPPITVATYSYSGIDRSAAITPLGYVIGGGLQKEIVIQEYDSPTELINAIENGGVDIAVPNLYGFLYAQSKDLDFAAIAIPDIPRSKAMQYRSVLVVKSGSKLKAEHDLVRYAKTLKVALVWSDSTSGGIIPKGKLRELGLTNPDEQFESFNYSGSHQKALDMLLEDNADVAGLAFGVLEERLQTQAELAKSIHIIWSSPPIPVGPILCVKSEKVNCNKVAKLLLGKNKENVQMMQALNNGWPEFGGATTLILPNKADYERLQL